MPSALSVTGIRGEALVDGGAGLTLRIDEGTLFLSPEAIRLLLPPGIPVQFEGLTHNRVHLRVTRGIFPLGVELTPSVTANGALLLRPEGVAGLLAGIFSGALRGSLQGKRGIAMTDAGLVLDLAQLLQPLGILVPPLRSVAAETGGATLEFRRTSS
jgi:hypothetical protein